MRPKHFTLTKLKARAGAELQLHYADGATLNVQLQDVIDRHRALAPLKDPARFAKAKVGEFGASVIWGDDDELELAADNLRARAIEQAGDISHEFILNWMSKCGLTVTEAAAALGLSPRMIAYYRSGEKPVPRTVALACIGWADMQSGRSDKRFVLAMAVAA